MEATFEQISQDQIARYSELIYGRTGIRISTKKQSLISNRLRKRMKANGINCYDDYFNFLVRANCENEWNALFEVITTHQTNLFRDQCQWDWFTQEYLQEMESLVSKSKRPRELRIWSAASSTGDEAYTFACCLAATLSYPKAWSIEILGTDIAQDTLQAAKRASFSDQAMQHVPEDWKQVYFSKDQDKGWTPSETLKNWTSFKLHNLMKPLREPLFDLVCLKNVLIYFDPASKKTVMDHLYKSIKPGGCLLTGPAEGVANLVGNYERLKPWLFIKPGVGAKKKAGK